MSDEIKRLFFGIEVMAPWPIELPKGRLLDEGHRHLTLVFFGNIPYEPLLKLLEQFPQPSFRVGSSGYFDACLTLPPRHPHVIAWQVHWMDSQDPLIAYQQLFSEWLATQHYLVDTRPWRPHVTLARQPFEADKWKTTFKPLPCYTSNIHLFESVGNLKYIPIWSYPLKPPFEEIEHKADMAFKIWGESLFQIYRNAFIALCFKAPEFLDYYEPVESINSLVDIIMLLNRTVSRVDSEIGSPMKAVSFHGEIEVMPDELLQWEMIVDV